MSKIALFCAQYDPHVGGIERYVKCLSLELKKRGHSVYVVTSNIYGTEDIQDREGIIVINLPCFNLLNGRLPIEKKNKRHAQLERVIEEIGVDIVIINARFYLLSLFAAKFAKKNRIPCITIEHGSKYIAFNKVWIDWLVRLYEKGITRRLKKFCKHYYGVSKDASAWLNTYGIKSEGEIHNAINVEECEREISKQGNNLSATLSNVFPIVSYAGRVIERKGILELNEAVNMLRPLFPGIKLYIAGDGELMGRLKKEKKETTVILGSLNHAEALGLIAASDVFVLASETEGFPTSVLEAMACKTFVITTYAGGSKEIITDDSYGILMDNNTSQTIYKSLKTALEDEQYRENAEEKCYNRVKIEYSWSTSAKKIEEIISQGKAV